MALKSTETATKRPAEKKQKEPSPMKKALKKKTKKPKVFSARKPSLK
jgi:hypothetical protein